MSLSIGYVHPSVVDAEFCRSLVETVFPPVPGLVRVLSACAPAGMLHMARNVVVRQFLDDESLTHLLFIDSDMVWTRDDVTALFLRVCTLQLPVVHAVCYSPLSTFDSVPVVYDENLKCVTLQDTGVQRVFCAGGAFMCIERRVFQVLEQTYRGPSPWFDYQEYRGRAVSEDVIFAARCAEQQIPIHVDVDIHVGHRKVATYQKQWNPLIVALA